MGVILRKRRKIGQIDLRSWQARNDTGRRVCHQTTLMVRAKQTALGLLHLSVLPSVHSLRHQPAVGSVSLCLKIQRILSKQKQVLLLPLLESPRSGTGNRPASLLDYSSFVIVPILDTPIFHDTIIYFLSKNIPEIQKTGTMSLLNDLQGFRSRFFKE